MLKIFFKIKNFILIHFQTKNILKNNYYTFKHLLNQVFINGKSFPYKRDWFDFVSLATIC